MAPKVVLISGANRGLGKALLERYLAKPNHTVIAANRDPSHPTSEALTDLPKAEGTSLLVLKVDAAASSDAAHAVKQLATHGIDHLDTVIANAGISFTYPKVSEVRVEDLQAHMVPNVYGLIWLYQATLPLLKKSTHPTWVTMGSSAAFLTVCLPQIALENYHSHCLLTWACSENRLLEQWPMLLVCSNVLIETCSQCQMPRMGQRSSSVTFSPKQSTWKSPNSRHSQLIQGKSIEAGILQT